MGLLNWAFAGAVGYGLYRYANGRRSEDQHAAFATGEPHGENFSQVRNAGPEGMRSDPPNWDDQDQRSDESFPASDPPATY